MTTMTLSITSRPASAFEPLELLRMVREVAECAGGAHPERISERAWDRARPLSERHADAPAAKRICEELGLPWRKVLELAFTAGPGRAIALGRALNDSEGNWLTEEYSDFVLALMARRLGVSTLTPGQYRTGRAAMLGPQRRRARPASQLWLPTEVQIEALYGTWDRALAHAGLQARQGRGGQLGRVQPVPILDVLDHLYQHHGTEPTAREAEVFASANGTPFPRRERGKPWSAYIAEWKQRRREQGLAVPDGPPPKAQRPDYSQDVGAALPGERRRKRSWEDFDEVVAWVMRYMEECRREGWRSSLRGYNDWAREQEGAPWSAAFEQHGGWGVVRCAASDRLGRAEGMM
jgi:hypothetical protein